MTQVTSFSAITQDVAAVPLAQYAQTIGYPENAFFGIRKDGDLELSCKEIWTKSERDEVARYLSMAQSMIEEQLNIPLTPKWVTDEEHDITIPIFLRWKMLQGVGTKLVTNIGLGVNVDNTSDPAKIAVTTAETDIANIHLFYPGESIEIPYEYYVTVLGGYEFYVPRARLVATAYQNNPRDGYSYTSTTHLLSTVDVKKITIDPSTPATLVSVDCSTCDPVLTALDCVAILSKRFGTVVVRQSTVCPVDGYKIRLNYMAYSPPTTVVQDIIIRLAHSLMPQTPCACDITRRAWERDRNIPQALTAPRVNCPFGMSDGAWYAWTAIEKMGIHRTTLV